ncbi:DUF4132 domain-containing protein [Micromonospora sp. NPDC092111]|uniref:DUF4132 domain-containing protein n=1 Tax=Micromonospora sp. NPDC092111 TaxID=3364289 RepID=UPI003824AE33
MGWSEVAGGYQVTLRDGEVVARNAKGRELRAVPTALRDDPTVVGLRQLTEWLARHETQCRADIERWMVRSLPVPVAVLTEVWPDEAWRGALTDLVVAVLDDDGGWDPDEVGLLREAGDAQIGLVNLDGETVRRAARRVVIPHPVRLADLDDLREFAADLQVRQSVDQLFRQTWVRGAGVDVNAVRCGDYSGGRYDQLRHLTARATKLGYPVRGGNAVCRVFEDGRAVEARSWVGADDPYYETETGDLVFTDRHGTALPLGAVGPVAWSEGTRMAAALYAGRIVAQQEDEQ